MLVGGFCLGYFVSSHPEDTRTFLARAKANVTALFQKHPPKQD